MERGKERHGGDVRREQAGAVASSAQGREAHGDADDGRERDGRAQDDAAAVQRRAVDRDDARVAGARGRDLRRRLGGRVWCAAAEQRPGEHRGAVQRPLACRRCPARPHRCCLAPCPCARTLCRVVHSTLLCEVWRLQGKV